MNIFTENLHSKGIDQYYLLTRDDEYRKEIKEKIQRIWEDLNNLKLIGDGSEKFVKEAQINFHGAVWQLELTYILNKKFNLIPPKEMGPDIIIENDKERIIIDCVSSNISGKHKVNRIYGQAEILDRDIRKLRVIESITKKFNSYKNWLDKNTVNPTDKFVIAIDTSNLPDAGSFGSNDVNILESVLFGYGKKFFVYNRETESFTIKFQKEKEIKKNNESFVTTNIFEDTHYTNISGIIWKNTNFLSDHSLTGKNLILFKNPMSKNNIELNL